MADDLATRKDNGSPRLSLDQVTPQAGPYMQYFEKVVLIGKICNEQLLLQGKLERCIRAAQQFTPQDPLFLAVFQPPRQLETYLATPGAELAEVRTITVGPQQWERLHAFTASLLPGDLVRFNLPIAKPTRLLPLISDGESLGILAVFTPHLEAVQAVLNLVCEILALTLKKEKLAQLIRYRNDTIIGKFFAELFTGPAERRNGLLQANLGFDSRRPHVVHKRRAVSSIHHERGDHDRGLLPERRRVATHDISHDSAIR